VPSSLKMPISWFTPYILWHFAIGCLDTVMTKLYKLIESTNERTIDRTNEPAVEL
jgi:hypothetical protein